MADNSDSIQWLQAALSENYVYAAVTTSLAYDIVYNFNDEVKYVWRGMRLSIPKLLYITARYYPFIYLMIETIGPLNNISTRFATITSCRGFAWYHGLGGFAVIATSVDMIFSYRASALYGNSKRIISFLVVGLLAQFTTAWTITVLLTIVDVELQYSLDGIVCASQSTPRYELLLSLQSIALGMSLAFNTALFVLTVIKAGMNFIQDNGGWKSIIRRDGNTFLSPIMVLVVRDGTIYFCILFVSTMVITITTSVSAFSTVAVYFYPYHFAILSFVGSRLILRLRQIADENTNIRTSNLTRSIFFAQPAPGGSTNWSDEGSNDEDA